MDAPEVRTIDDLTIDELREWIADWYVCEVEMYQSADDDEAWYDLGDLLLDAYEEARNP